MIPLLKKDGENLLLDIKHGLIKKRKSLKIGNFEGLNMSYDVFGFSLAQSAEGDFFLIFRTNKGTILVGTIAPTLLKKMAEVITERLQKKEI